jgi:uncharacterized membrane protein
MRLLSPHHQLMLCLCLAGSGLVLFFTGEYRDLGLPFGGVGIALFIVAVWFAVDAVYRVPKSEAEAAIAPGEWQAWVGSAFLGAVLVSSVLNLPNFAAHLPIGNNPHAGAAGRGVGMLLTAWWVLDYVLRQRWAGQVLSDERDLQIERKASQCARVVMSILMVALAILLGFSDTEHLARFSYPYLAQLLVITLVCGFWVDHFAAALLYWRDRNSQP